MAQLNITKTYDDGLILTEADLDNIKNDVETFLNVTKLSDDNLQDAGITASSKLIDASISTAKYANASVTAAKLAADAVGTASIADDSVTAAKLRDDPSIDANRAVTTDHIRDNAITKTKIADDAVGSAELQDDPSVDGNRAVTSDHIRDGAITQNKMANNAITNNMIIDSQITVSKMAARNSTATPGSNDIGISSSSGAFSNTTTSFTTVTNLSVTINIVGRPIIMQLIPDGSGSAANIKLINNVGAGSAVNRAKLRFRRGGGQIALFEVGSDGTTNGFINDLQWPVGAFYFIDNPGAGTHTYDIQAAVNTAVNDIQVNFCKLVVYEM